MASGSTPISALPYPLPTDTPSVHSDIQALANALDGKAIVSSGLAAALPSAGTFGHRYYATDTRQWFIDTGSAWQEFLPSRGATNISTSQSTGSTTFTTLTTSDQVTVTLPANGLIRVWYQATWQESVAGAARAAIFIGSNQAQIAVGSTGTVQPRGQAAATNASGTGINQNQILASFYGGLLSAGRNSGGAGYTGDVTTGQIVGAAADNSNGYVAYEHLDDIVIANTGAMYGGPCDIFAAAGTVVVSVKYKAASGSVTAQNRKLWVQAIPFS